MLEDCNCSNHLLLSIVNFWVIIFRVLNQCIQKIEGVCAAFLWFGPNLNQRKAKVAWQEICRPKKEGGLGLKSLKEANVVSYSKLMYRIISNNDPLWVKWIMIMFLRNGSLWSLRELKAQGSWLVKY